MIDPKLNVSSPVPAESASGTAKEKEAAAARLQKVSAGLSVNNTVSANADLSTGGRGVDTSGTSAGSGAGAGMTKLTSDASTVPEIVPDGRSSGTTALGSSNTQAPLSTFPNGKATEGFADSEVSELAYQAWCERGCPVGSPEVDWEAAVGQLRSRRAKSARA